jgi:hypothetical protein
MLKSLSVIVGLLMPSMMAQQYMNAAAIEEKVRN